MPDEDKQDVVEEVKPDPATGKLPESIPTTKYIGVKEAYGRAKEKAASLAEQLKNAPSKEEFDKINQKLTDTTAELEKVKTELNQGKEKTVSELREALKGNEAFTEEELKGMSETELRAAVKASGSKKSSLPDLSGGGGSGGAVPQGSPLDLARQAYAQPSKK